MSNLQKLLEVAQRIDRLRSAIDKAGLDAPPREVWNQPYDPWLRMIQLEDFCFEHDIDTRPQKEEER